MKDKFKLNMTNIASSYASQTINALSPRSADLSYKISQEPQAKLIEAFKIENEKVINMLINAGLIPERDTIEEIERIFKSKRRQISLDNIQQQSKKLDSFFKKIKDAYDKSLSK